jgi:hypothetical protein
MGKPTGEPDAELISRVMSAIGSRTSEKKAKSSAANVAPYRFKPRPLLELACTCGGGAVLTVEAHKTTCARGRAIRRRVAAGQPLEVETTST